jgi:hypothetical protein
MSNSFIGSGKIKIADYSSGSQFSNRQFRDVGNASVFQFAFSQDLKTLRDFQDPAGGIADTAVRLDVASGQIDLREFNVANLAMALWGTTSALNATAITGEAGHFIKINTFMPTNRLMNTSIAPVVKKGATTILAADYTVSKAGITFNGTITTGGGVVDGDPITIDYTPVLGADVQALINTSPNVSIFFEGVNAVTGKYTSVRIYKAKLGVPQNIDMIGEDFGSMTMSFTCQKDTTVSSTGKFLAMEQES